MKKRKPPAKGRPAKRVSTALVVRKKPALVRHAPVTTNGYTVAQDGSLQLGALGITEIKLTEAEEKILSEPVDPALVKWRASRKDGPLDVPYLPHPVYTKWFNRAFGRTGWNLVPVSKPIKDENNVVLIAYVLHVHTMPVAFAWGEQEYFERKSDGTQARHQTYGDVIESTVASALRRCAKHLGVGLELWDKDWTGALRAGPPQEGVPFDRRKGARRTNRPAQPIQHDDAGKPITDEQRLRMWTISRRVGRSDAEVQKWLKSRYNVAKSAMILRRDYDGIVEAIEAKGPLPDRDPGGEG